MNREYGIQSQSINTKLESRVRAPGAQQAGAMKFTAGRGFDDAQMSSKPAVLVPLFGMPEDQVAGICRFLYQSQLMSMEFRPILYTDMNVMSVCRPYGWILEHHMSEYDAAKLGCWSSWESSVIFHAQYIAEFFKVEHVLLPDYVDGLQSFTRRLGEIGKARVGRFVPNESSNVSRVSGWRAWSSGPHRPARVYNVETFSAGAVRVEISGGSNENLLLMDGPTESDMARQFMDAAKAREWPMIRTDSLGILDPIELEVALRSLVSMCSDEGTVVIFADGDLVPRIKAIVTDERIEVRSTDAVNSGESAQRELSMADIELRTTIRRASSAFVR